MIRNCAFETPVGCITLTEEQGVLIALHFCDLDDGDAPTPLLRQAFCQLKAYFSGQRHTFSLPLAPQGTPFQQIVWCALQTIPYGQTCSYKYIAEVVNHPTAYRAVGQAIHQNPLPLLIPCHRVIEASGKITGYAGGLALKQQLLEIETAEHIMCSAASIYR
ncbi:MAG: methylated-DNA--[protein]-cysteine S-methyltransferase [Alistipes sp.]